MMIDHDARPREGVTIPRFYLTLALSILIHAAVLYKALPQLRHMTLEEPEQGVNSGRLAVRLAPPPSAPVSRNEPSIEPAPKVIARPPLPKVRPTVQSPPVLALNKQPGAPAQPATTPAPPVEVAPPPRPPAENDFAAAVEARRRAREGATPQVFSPGMIASAPAETEADRARRITSANLAPKQQVFGYDPTAGGGVFQIRRISLNDAEVAFYGWNREIKRKTLQMIDISKGNNNDIRIAVVRKMIAIIREYESEDFRWESRGRTVTLSARARDNNGLEEFMLREFFPDQAVAR
jgi:hypothetical protein